MKKQRYFNYLNIRFDPLKGMTKSDVATLTSFLNEVNGMKGQKFESCRLINKEDLTCDFMIVYSGPTLLADKQKGEIEKINKSK